MSWWSPHHLDLALAVCNCCTFSDFYARKQRVLAIAFCLSVCLSHGWIRQKRSKLGSPNLHHRLPGRL